MAIQRRLEPFAEMLWALQSALLHLEELKDAWARGAINESDGLGGTRSNRNVDCARLVRTAIAKATSPQAR
jgi:hypothetical protein